ncbi:Pls/PosA family non-ribosomal peptide synthetase [Agilicoccus flavus]|uniref:Pls/PosA family non-ribosomal peptide synthetase n=1 Tax=Agilicoccus flavus TaxID=2775968 RepID=UPI001CF679D9|nr:Pls/PosA family non-ribosomal peptide synthetase [Agilicoccus flavus]
MGDGDPAQQPRAEDTQAAGPRTSADEPADAQEARPDALRSVYRLGGLAPAPRTLVDVLEETVSRHGGAPALDDGEQILSYRDLWRQARSTAGRLAAAGVRRGDRVGIRVSSGHRSLYVAILGVLVAGAAYVPVDADDPDERARLVFGEAGIAALVTDDGITGVPRAGRGGPDEEPGVGASGRTAPEHPGPDDDAWIIFTSGSTGTPKGVAVSHRSAAAFVDAEARLFCQERPLGVGDRVLAGLSVAFDASCEEMWLAWRHGACLVPAPRSLVRSGIDLGPWLVSRRVSVVSTVPTLASLWPADTLAQVRLLIFGGEGLPAELAARLLDPDREVWNTYGPTEATVVACAARMGAEGPVRIGTPLEGWDLAVVDGSGHEVAPGEVGELIIGGVGLARYLDPAKDAEKFAPMPTLGWERAYRSGDLVRLEADGLVFMGRADEQVKLGGRRIELGEIDAALQSLPGVSGAACAVQTTAGGHQLLVGYLLAEQPGYDLGAAQDLLRAELPAALVPRLALVDDLPTRTSGKVDRAALPWPLPGQEPARGAADAAPLEGTAAWLAGRWGAVLGVEAARADDDFFSLGGGSLAAAQLVTLLRERAPRVTVGDLYDYPRLNAQAAMLDEMAPTDSGPARVRTVRPVPVRAQVIQVVVSLGLLAVGALRWLVALLLVGTALHGVDGFAWLPTASWWVLAPLFVLVLTPPGQMGLSVLLSRLLLRGVGPGDYPRGGGVHLRLWACERFADRIGATGMAGAPWIIYYARALGAKVGRGVDLHALPPVTGLLTLGGGCAVEPEVDLSGHWVDGDVLHVGHVKVSAHATVGARSTLLPGARVGRGATIEAGSTVHGAVPAAQVWAGSPAGPVRGKWQGPWPSHRPPRRRGWVLAYAVTALALALLPLLAAVPGLAVLAFAARGAARPPDALGPLLLAAPAATVLTMAVLAGATIALVRLLAIGLTEGFHPVRSRVGWQVWATERLLDSARTLLFPVYASLATPWWLRALGARIGRDVEASTVLLLPAMTRVDDGAFLADDTLVAGYELRQGWMRVERARVGKRAFLGNSGMTAPGRKVPRDGLVAVLSTAPMTSKAGTSWVGSPPTRLRRATVDTAGSDAARTYAPPRRLKIARALVEACRVVPVMVSVAIGVVVAVGLAQAWRVSPWLAVLLGGPILVAAGAVAAGVTVAAKWLLVGRFRAVEHPLWSSFVWRNELADTFVETVAGPWFAWAATGTPALNLWLRCMGATIGRGVWCETYWLPESDLVDLGAGATVNRGCVLQTHLFHDRIMSMDTVTLADGATMGPHGVILPAASIGTGSSVGPGSLVLRGDAVPAGSTWAGNPIRPWDREDADA